MTKNGRQRWLMAGLGVLLAAGGYFAWQKFGHRGLPAGIASGNGRIEATEIDIAAKIPGRIKEILADEGDFVTAGQVLVRMDTEQLEAQRRQAKAQRRRALIGVDTAKSLVTSARRNAERRSLPSRSARHSSTQRRKSASGRSS